MKVSKRFASGLIIGISFAFAIGTTLSISAAENSPQSAPAAQPEMQLPPGWTADDMQACMVAAMPGKMHERLAQDVGVWQGKSTMWMYPGADPVKSDCTYTVTAILDGRFIKTDMAGEIPGMGPYSGIGITGFDNVSQQLVGNWIDNASTGIANGTGELSPDGKTMTWNYTFNCPITKKPAVLRQIETLTSPTTKTIEAFTNDPKSGQEFKMMSIEFTKQ
jgi:hypothetical protein